MTTDHLSLAGEGFARGARYERARPGYPAGAVDALTRACGIGQGTRVLDLAAGTGKLTRHLVACGAQVVAVEPVAGMRAHLASTIAGVQISDGTAEDIPAADGSMDAVTVGQAFHWFDGPAAVREIHRVLAPGGALGLIWNVMDRRVAWVGVLQDLIHRYRGPSPWYWGHAWRVAVTSESGFGLLEHDGFANAQEVDVEGLVERVASISFIATLPDGAQRDVLREVRRIAGDHLPGQPSFAIPYITDVFWTRRIDDAAPDHSRSAGSV